MGNVWQLNNAMLMMRWVCNVVGVRCQCQCSRVHSSAAKMRLSCCGELAVAPLGLGSVGVAAGLGRGHQARETAVQTVNLCALVHLGSRGVG